MIIKKLEYYLWVENFWLAAGLSSLLLSLGTLVNFWVWYYTIFFIVFLEILVILCGLIITLLSAHDHNRFCLLVRNPDSISLGEELSDWRFFFKLLLAFLLGNLLTGFGSCILLRYCMMEPQYKMAGLGFLIISCLYVAVQKCLATRSLIKHIEISYKK